MALRSLNHVLGVQRSLSGKAWLWRGGNMEIDPASSGIGDNITTQLLKARGVSDSDIPRNLNPTMREFLPDPSIFKDMDSAAERIVQAILSNEKITVYGDYDVDGATSAALLINLLNDLGAEAEYYIPDRLLEGYGPSGEALIKLEKQAPA